MTTMTVSSVATILVYCCLLVVVVSTDRVGATEYSATSHDANDDGEEGPLTIPVPAQYFDKQLVDHLKNHTSTSIDDYDDKTKYWSQRYYTYDKHWKGAGHPIFLIMGGEGAIPPTAGIYYPVIAERFAQVFGAYALQPEHRFYGESQPISRNAIDQARKDGKIDPRVQLLTAEQALYDAVRLVEHTRYNVLQCSKDRFSPSQYCPVIIVGGSYPGFLAAMGRLRFPHVIDMAYAASAPMKFYAQTLNQTSGQHAYYNHITTVANQAVPGCARAVRSTLSNVEAYYQKNQSDIDTRAIGICNGTLPGYITSVELFLDEVIMMVGYTFANANMGYYPPSNSSRLYQACSIFVDTPYTSSLEKLKKFLVTSLGGLSIQNDDCFNMTQQLPAGLHATISAGDWSGVGTGTSGESWDFQTCTLLVEAIGFGPFSMFATTTTTRSKHRNRNWSLDWLKRHCQDRFGQKVVPRPHELVDQWHFDPEHLVQVGGASRILFTNGLRDGWSVSGIQTNLSKDVLAINFPNGAHHSDLNGMGNQSSDTDDIRQGTKRIQTILATWLEDMPFASEVREGKQQQQPTMPLQE